MGRVAAEVRYDRGKGKDQNITIARFSLATNERFEGSRSKVFFHNVVAFGGKADTCNKWCKKGTLIAIKGKLRTNKWQDEQGNTRYGTQVNIDEITFIGKKEDYAGGPKEEEAAPKKYGDDDPL